MLRRGAKTVRALPRRDGWHSLQEYALGNNAETFRVLRARDAEVTNVIAAGGSAPKAIDWKAWEGKISHKEVLECLKDFHQQQSALLADAAKGDHHASVAARTNGWELFDEAVKSCENSVEKSHDILRNGARALWISYQNPPISLLSQSEWLDADQYWQAFVEKHHFYHNHLASAVQDPESKEYDAQQKADLIKKWQTFDGKGTNRQNNKLLYQRPSYEYYDLYRGPLVEHMIFYLTKTGGDARFFPENMPVQWFAEIYDVRFKIYNVLQRRLRQVHEATLVREKHHDFHPSDLEHDGEGHFAKLIAREASATEHAAARLMGNYILFSDAYIPVQTGTGCYRALQTDGGKGTFYSLGKDVNALFYKPSGDELATPDPKECFNALSDHAALRGVKFEVGYAAALEAFAGILESRKDGLGGVWYNVHGESSREAFMRRLKKSDPAYAIFEAYAEEHAERWAAATALSMEDALAHIPEIEQKYALECAAYDNVLFGISDEFSPVAKAEHEKMTKLADDGKLQALLDSGKYVAVQDGAVVKSAEEVMSNIAQFETGRDKAVDTIMATKIASLK